MDKEQTLADALLEATKGILPTLLEKLEEKQEWNPEDIFNNL